MNKSAIKKFATSARKSLIESIKRQVLLYGIKKDKVDKPDYQSDDAVIINGIVYPKEVKDQLSKLTHRLNTIGYESLIEEVAYTWFNRFIALRFMEVNKYLSVNTLALSSSTKGKSEPDIITDALKLNLPVDKEKIYYYQDKKDTNSLYRYLIITLCNHLNKYLPFMFERINDYTELLFPDNILSSQSFIRSMVDDIPIEDFTQVEIIGWMYQFYVSERNDEVQALLKKNIKVTKENIAPITQRFTPKWIVKYMVENTIGSLWTSTYKQSSLNDLKYLIKPAEQEDEVNKILSSITPSSISPEEIKILDPAAGSGHILVYAFELLYEIYKEAGYMPSSIPKLILQKNLYGLEIDDRAAQLASFALLMKARGYKKNILDENIIPNILSIQESNEISNLDTLKYPNLNYLTNIFHDAKEYGSIIQIGDFDYDTTLKELNTLKESQDLISQDLYEKLFPLLIQAQIMTDKYDCVITNPPYMGSGNMNPTLSSFVQKYYKDSKSDMFAVFMELCIKMAKDNGYVGMISQHQWMFLSSFEKLRVKLLNSITINSMAHLGSRAFKEVGGEVVQNTMFSLKKINIQDYIPTFVRLVGINNADVKERTFLTGEDRFCKVTMKNLLKIPGYPLTYWISNKVRKIFENSKKVEDIAESKAGLQTGDNGKFIRFWYEVIANKIGLYLNNRNNTINHEPKWFPINKGGGYRKWYGNNEWVVNWENDGYDIRNYKDRSGKLSAVVRNKRYYFNEGLISNLICVSNFAVRYSTKGFIFDISAPTLFSTKNKIQFLAAFLNTALINVFLNILNPSLNFPPGNIASLPIIIPEDEGTLSTINTLAQSCIDISRTEWDSRETSWDFKANELIRLKDSSNLIQSSVDNYIKYWTDKFNTLHSNEEKLNKIFIDIYDMADELTPDVDKKDITILKDEALVSNVDLIFKQEVLVKHLISYAVGVIFGRYSLDTPGIAYAGGEYDSTKYISYIPDKDAILPVLSDDYFEDDIVSKFIEFLKVAFSKSTLSQNIEYIANTLGKNANESSIQRIRRYFVNDFYKEHLKMYKKRPIYFMFSSGPAKAFNALVYIHRYNSSTLAKLRLDYLHHLISKLDSTEEMLKNDLITQAIKISRKLAEISKQRQELKRYDELLHNHADKNIEIDLDDGIKINYAKFESLVVSI
jgi:type II restriction/modification system DNA methylase subunit YeeA